LDEQLNKAAGRVVERPYLQDDVRGSLDVRRALNLAWMPLSPETLVRSLFSKQHYLISATPDFTEQERALLAREADAPFTEADVPLLDEAAELLGDFSKVTGAAAAGRGARRRSPVPRSLAGRWPRSPQYCSARHSYRLRRYWRNGPAVPWLSQPPGRRTDDARLRAARRAC